MNYLKVNHIPIYHLEYQGKQTYRFFSLHHYHKALKTSSFVIERQGSTGFLFFFLSFFKRPYRLFGWSIALCLFFYLGQLSWGTEISGSRQKVTDDLYRSLTRYGLARLSPLKSQNELNQIQNQICLDYNDEIDWLNLYLDGHIYQISYTPKVTSKQEKANYAILVASDDAVVDRIEVSKGQVLVTRNQHVKKGDILVTNEIISTSEDVKLIETKGKIFGYTYKTYEASMQASDLADDFVYLRLKLLEEVNKEIGEDGYIDKENVLHYEAKEGTISLKVQFTLYKNIAQKEIFNEQ